jgi:hypothetical protein
MLSRLETAWLEYAREVVEDGEHHSTCASRGGSDASLGFAPDVRWPGYLGRDYRRGGVLWLANVHTSFATAGLGPRFAQTADESVRRWRGRFDSDETFLDGLRNTYEIGLATWTVGGWPRRALERLGVPIAAVAYSNAARCQATDTGIELQRHCLKRWPVQRLLDLLEPDLVLLTSKTTLDATASSTWRCPVAAFSQRNGRLLQTSPWHPVGDRSSVSYSSWINPLVDLWP